ncbi:PAS domain S-box protein, partial [Arthrospira platensis SPKY2]
MLARWRHDAFLLLITAGGGLLLTLATIGYLMRRILLAQKRELRYHESQRLAANLFERSNDGVIITDASTRILAVNPAFQRITGYSTTE